MQRAPLAKRRHLRALAGHASVNLSSKLEMEATVSARLLQFGWACSGKRTVCTCAARTLVPHNAV